MLGLLPINQIDPLDVRTLTNEELLAKQSELRKIRETYFDKINKLTTDPRYKKRMGNGPVPVINSLFENVYKTVNDEVIKRDL